MAAPRELLPRLRYRGATVALALALWSVERRSGWQVRAQVSPLASVGDEPLHGWRSLSRWARTCHWWWRFMRAGPPSDARAAALQAVTQLAAKAPMPTGRLAIDACAGAAIAMPIDPASAVVLVPPSPSVAL